MTLKERQRAADAGRRRPLLDTERHPFNFAGGARSCHQCGAGILHSIHFRAPSPAAGSSPKIGHLQPATDAHPDVSLEIPAGPGRRVYRRSTNDGRPAAAGELAAERDRGGAPARGTLNPAPIEQFEKQLESAENAPVARIEEKP